MTPAANLTPDGLAFKTLLVKWHLTDDGIERATINAGQ
jgi:hypothetical protein